MSNSEKTDFEAASAEYLNSYLDKKFPKELRNNYVEAIGMIRAGFFVGVEFVKLYYHITRK